MNHSTLIHQWGKSYEWRKNNVKSHHCQVFIVNLENIQHIYLLFRVLTLNIHIYCLESGAYLAFSR